MRYEVQRKVRFQHCDPAAIVFFPRYFEMINSVVEDWFEEVVGVTFNDMHVNLRTGVPTANINTDFTAPSRLGETLNFQLRPVKIGGASLTLDINAWCNEQHRLRSQSTLVYINIDTGRPLPWPDDMRQCFANALDTGIAS